MDFVSWVENSALGTWMVDSVWAYPIMLSTHAVGMSIVVGTILMIDLRVLGYTGDAPLKAFKNMFMVTWFGVLLNFGSGLALFTSDPAKFCYHPVFWAKIVLMVSGVVSTFFLWRELHVEDSPASQDLVVSSRIKLQARLSLFLWLGVIVAGRLIGYIEIE